MACPLLMYFMTDSDLFALFRTLRCSPCPYRIVSTFFSETTYQFPVHTGECLHSSQKQHTSLLSMQEIVYILLRNHIPVSCPCRRLSTFFSETTYQFPVHAADCLHSSQKPHTSFLSMQQSVYILLRNHIPVSCPYSRVSTFFSETTYQFPVHTGECLHSSQKQHTSLLSMQEIVYILLRNHIPVSCPCRRLSTFFSETTYQFPVHTAECLHSSQKPHTSFLSIQRLSTFFSVTTHQFPVHAAECLHSSQKPHTSFIEPLLRILTCSPRN